MFTNFTRRNKLDYEPCQLRYKYIPSAFRYDLLKLLFDKLQDEEGSVVREYCLYRSLSVSINKDHFALFGYDEIHENYSSDLLIELIRKSDWHEVLMHYRRTCKQPLRAHEGNQLPVLLSQRWIRSCPR